MRRPTITLAQRREAFHAEPTAATTKPDDDKRIETWVLFTRNLQHYPLARHPRSKMKWKTSRKEKLWWCDLSDELQLRFPAHTEREQLRALSGLDVKLLLLLLRERVVSGSRELNLTNATLLRELGLRKNGDNVARVQSAVWILSQIELWHRRWRAGDSVQERVLNPPIRKLTRIGHTHHIELDAQWVDKRYCTRLPLDLPTDAIAQCLLMMIWAHPVEEYNSRERHGTRDLQKLYRKLGLQKPRNNRRSLQNGIDLALKWLKQHGGELKISIKRRFLTFDAIMPKVGNKSVQKQRSLERILREAKREANRKQALEKARENEAFRRALAQY